MTKHEERLKSLAMIKNQDNWPAWPVLPLKRWDGNDTITGFMLAGEPVKPIVYVENMFALHDRPLSEIPRGNYNNYEELLDWWEID